ncbi:IS66 family insertion sequence element accessory protein TnpA, partial [Motiliproteus sp. MSK22-1]|uniref:IS66 family insertion sequence element accessory protein TnpA n=1 Tax=Motiliproteus sp. MSK22-1 TaxID=1897630 RepID=UPI00387E8D82
MTANELKALRETWKQHLDTWKQSGQSQVDYCRKQGLKPHQMTYWKKRFVKSKPSPK